MGTQLQQSMRLAEAAGPASEVLQLTCTARGGWPGTLTVVKPLLTRTAGRGGGGRAVICNRRRRKVGSLLQPLPQLPTAAAAAACLC